MASRRKLLWTLVVLLVVVIAAAWALSIDLQLGWLHILGLAATLALLALIWFWPGRQEPKEPPP
jgi:cyanate permease